MNNIFNRMFPRGGHLIPIPIFHVLDELINQEGENFTTWAKKMWPEARVNYQSRLSEQRAVYIEYMNTIKNPKDSNEWIIIQQKASQKKAGGRKWNISLCLRAIVGARLLLGGRKVKEELIKAAEKEDIPIIKGILYMLAHIGETDEGILQGADLLSMNLRSLAASKKED